MIEFGQSEAAALQTMKQMLRQHQLEIQRLWKLLNDFAPGAPIVEQGLPTVAASGGDDSDNGTLLMRGILQNTLTGSGTAAVGRTVWTGVTWAYNNELYAVQVGLPITANIESGKVVWFAKAHDAYFVVAAEC